MPPGVQNTFEISLTFEIGEKKFWAILVLCVVGFRKKKKWAAFGCPNYIHLFDIMGTFEIVENKKSGLFWCVCASLWSPTASVWVV